MPHRTRGRLQHQTETVLVRQGQTVLHPFAGSGTTGVAALERGRRFVGVELSEAYAAAPGAVGEPTVN